jgi:uncharacterized protein (DUF1778 family)
MVQTARAASRPQLEGRKADVIQIRASAEVKAMLNQAAALRGQKLSEFMLESARRSAVDTLLDQRAFFLDDERHAEFIRMLDRPAKPSATLRAKARRRPLWSR